MRKKLLALVMCATMVLGTAVTAVAAPLKADFDAAKKVFENGKEITGEIGTNESAKKVPVTVNVDLEGGVTYGFVGGKAVRLNEKGDYTLKYIGDITYGDGVKKGAGTINASVVASNAILEATSKLGANAILDDVKVAYVANISAAAAPAEYKVAVATLDGKTTANITEGDVVVNYYSLKNTAKYLSGDEAADFMTKDKYSYDETDVKPQKALIQTSSEVGSYVFSVANFDQQNVFYTERQLNTVAYALEAGTLTKDSIALVFNVQQIVKNTGADKAKHPYVLEKVTAPVAAVTLTMENDWFSNTALKAKTVKTFRVSDTLSSDGKYALLSLVESGIDLSESYGKFDVTFSVINGQSIVIFDVDANAAKDNAGQADSDKTSSPKTGDVAPIAALAVVMMGAFGAMVVASKKRA